MKPGQNVAVILAAGMGIRLEELGQQIPKGFIDLGDGPIVRESIRKLRACGIKRVVIVAGHLAEFFERLQTELGSWVEIVRSRDFATTGSMESLTRAADIVHDNILLVESDIVYEQRAISLLLEHSAKDIVLASGPTMAGDEVFVRTVGTNVRGISKAFSRNEPSIAGEFVGLCKLSGALVREMCARAATRGAHSGAYELDVLPQCLDTFDVQCLAVPDLVWGEIDDWQQWDHVRRVVMPRLRELENRQSTHRKAAHGSAQDPPCYAC